ncbi:dihydroxyacetone kinase, L subunit [Latilactobacillus graminis DSM 20719]|uniref:phosphoenolpyruvate--glycerone phosphotransferase n=2 Tax=Latilactobacillus graminis TaxID=60519 RepID=A0AA89I2J4_9LACO|nr:dihydroxyacetone kinase, L subunit [Latilactobacillus graminis DSM 20719]
MGMLTVENTLKWLELFNAKIQAEKDYLSELDTPIGDGDHGNNMSRGLLAVHEALTTQSATDVPSILKTTAMMLISKVGGASGPLYGTAFLEMAKLSSTTLEVAPLLAAGLAGIQKRGHAQVGEKTLIDVWTPVIQAVEADMLDGATIETAVMATKDMQATKGRASYVGERSIGHIDPGAASSGYLFTTMLMAGVVS